MSTRCKKVLSLQLLEQQGDALGAEEAEWLSEHLTTCAECRAESLVLSTLGEDRIEAHLLPMDELTRRRDQDAVLLRLAAKRQRLHETPSWKKRAVVGSGVLMVLAVVGLLLTV
jgi:predicted anti-sigma-YlaC factor YlaD